MAYSTPATKSTGNVIGATDWNEHVTDIRYLAQADSDGRPICIAYRSTNQSIANTTLTAVTWNAETLDNAACHSTSSNTARFSAPVDGWYSAEARLVWAANNLGMRSCNILFNGTGTQISLDQCAATNAFETAHTAVWLGQMTSGQYIEAYAYQNTGGALNLLGSATAPRCEFVFQWERKL